MFVERVWRSVEYERVYLKAYDGVSAARADIPAPGLVQHPQRAFKLERCHARSGLRGLAAKTGCGCVA